jgi:hypothetical protein
MSFSLPFHTLKEKLPKNTDRIAFFDCRQCIKTLQQGSVFYKWVLQDMDDGKIDTEDWCEFCKGDQWDENFLLIEKDTSGYDKFRWTLAYDIDGDRNQYLMLADDPNQNIYWISLTDTDIIIPNTKNETSF